MNTMIPFLETALQRRQDLFTTLQAENTDCYRLFWGTNEGVPGLTVDRYGPQLLIQAFHRPLEEQELAEITAVAQTHFNPLEIIYNDRSAPHSRRKDEFVQSEHSHIGHELGVKYLLKGKHQGQDPLLFLDLRAGRRWILGHALGQSVLNLFAYTCGLGICAAVGGAREVWNVDFANSSLLVGTENAHINELDPSVNRMIQSDFFTLVRQLAGLPVKQRYVKNRPQRTFIKMEPRQFDIVCMDPPRWSKSPFGTIDLIRDYPSLLKPALLATKEGGQLLVTNHVPQVELTAWCEQMQRCAIKAGRRIHDIDILEPEADFPSRDRAHPLKIALLFV